MRKRPEGMSDDDWEYYRPQYCNAAVSSECRNPCAWGVNGAYATNSDGPRITARCKQCDDPCCAECRTGKRGAWLCLNCVWGNEEQAERARLAAHDAIREPLYAMMGR